MIEYNFLLQLLRFLRALLSMASRKILQYSLSNSTHCTVYPHSILDKNLFTPGVPGLLSDYDRG